MRIILPLVLGLVVSLVAASAFAPWAIANEVCPPPGKEVAPKLAKLEEAMESHRFITYQPSSLQVVHGRIARADAESIRADLKVLRPYFDALITYTARDGAELIPAIAAELGFKAMIIGIWTPSDREEVGNALAEARAHPDLVQGFSLGNEIVFSKRGEWKNLEAWLNLIRARAPDIPLSTTEPFAWFLDQEGGRALASKLDFVLANVHPVFEPWFRTAPAPNWANFVVQVTENLHEAFCRPIIIKESGTPSAPETDSFKGGGYTPAMQAEFWRALEAQFKPSRKTGFSYFSAFDAPWREFDRLHPGDADKPEEAHWGLFDDKRVPKPVILEMKPLDGR